MKREESHRAYEAICNAFGDMKTFIEEYYKEEHDFQSMIYDDFRDKLFEAETYFYELESDGKEKALSDDELEEYGEFVHCCFIEELRDIFEEYKSIEEERT